MTILTARPAISARRLTWSRQWFIALILLFICLALAIYALGTGTLSLSATQVIDALRGEGPRNLSVIVNQWRLPRVSMALIIGIAVRALFMAGNTWLLISASLESALSAGLWNAGSLNGITWAKSTPVIGLIIAALLMALLLSRRMKLLEMGDDTACALGVAVEPSRLLLMLAGVALTAAATAVAGPISFIALVAPQIARRLCPNQSQPLILAALCGALLLLAADVIAQRVFLPYQLPVGVLTVSLGGIYLIGLLVRESRRK